jgi:hypothetical protein
MKIPFWPLAITLGAAFFVQAFQFLLDGLNVVWGQK